jgi:hypothetical protein
MIVIRIAMTPSLKASSRVLRTAHLMRLRIATGVRDTDVRSVRQSISLVQHGR